MCTDLFINKTFYILHILPNYKVPGRRLVAHNNNNKSNKKKVCIHVKQLKTIHTSSLSSE